VEFHGEFYDFAPMDPRPVPVQRPIPILIGGHSDAALTRAVRIGDGWISAPMSAERLSERLDTLRRIAESHCRSVTDLFTVASVSFASPASFATDLQTYRGIDVDHLQVLLATDDPAVALAQITRLQEIRAAS
jgi:alkanesulfonate monooxygenase SsuD/methylene tetrahydromethanopterin reductase-like flavin-dependent oxidoreductase (luciferase family)